ncbi:MAG: pyridoxamine 5'-phosphate oxidase family protein [Anaerolineae bacterium]|nr:pyridoxamine 5'-phosphate oxidase family protein [Anaerolineae bacterium]
MQVQQFAEIEQEFIERVFRVVWCAVATVDAHNRPRTRVLHPYWEVVDGRPVGWIATGRHTAKAGHLAQNAHVSLAYVGEVAKPVYVECLAEWQDDAASKQHVWDAFKNAAPPMGYDPEPIFKAVDDPDFGILKLTPWRVEVTNYPHGTYVWRG